MNSIRMQEEIERKRIEERRIGALQIMQQIQENEQVRARPQRAKAKVKAIDSIIRFCWSL